jgi:hypothetical protein
VVHRSNSKILKRVEKNEKIKMKPEEIELINDILLELTDELNERGYVLPEHRIFKQTTGPLATIFPRAKRFQLF